MRHFFHQPALWGSVFRGFFQFNLNASSEMNQIWNDSSICIDGATLKILVLCVSWFARILAHRQTDRRTRQIHKRLFSDEKSAKKENLRSCSTVYSRYQYLKFQNHAMQVYNLNLTCSLCGRESRCLR